MGHFDRLPFSAVWAVDFEFTAPPGERPEPVCLVARELRSGKLIRVWQDELRRMRVPPYPTGADALFIAYFASAEFGCHQVLGWPMPERVLDLYTEHRARFNGIGAPAGNNLLGALAANGTESIDALEKEEMRELVLRGGPWTSSERAAILDYCQTDVDALQRLLPAMLPTIDLPRAILRGRYMAAVARMEHVGVPVDQPILEQLRAGWDAIKLHLVEEIDADFGVYDGTTFKLDRFSSYLARMAIPWPRLGSGRLDLSDETFRDRARAHPELEPLRNLRHALSQMRLNDLAVGRDGRNRLLLSPFGSRSSRNTPSNTKFIFGPSAWLRGLIRPPPGHGLAYVDWSSQEVGIAAAFSGDPMLIAAYQSGDPYLAFAKQIGAVSAEATKATHKAVRDQFKAVVLGVNYGMPDVAEIEAIVSIAPGNLANLIRFAQYTGMRQEEIGGLERKQVRYEPRAIDLWKTKSNRPRTVSMDERAAGTYIGTVPHLHSRWLFWHHEGERYRRISNQFNTLIKRATRDGLIEYGFRFHDLRHWFAVDYLRRGGNIYDLQQELGHSSVQTTEIYLDFLKPDEQREAKFGAGTKPGTATTVRGGDSARNDG